MSIAKCPPRRRVSPLPTVSPSQRVSEMILSACPGAGSLTMRLPPPSMTPAPTNPMLCRLSPQIIASWKWLCPKSWYWSLGLASGTSYPLGAPTSVAPAASDRVTLLSMWMEDPAR
jgi:hypothetical protein